MTIRHLHRSTASTLAAALLAATFLVACGDDGDARTAATADPSTIEVDGAWARTSPSMATAGAAYMTITNTGDVGDSLRGGSVDPSVAGSVELHQTVAAEGDDSMTTTTGMGGGTMTMVPVDEIIVSGGETVALEPGGYHLMLLDLVEPLEVGATVELTLTFERAGEIEVTADVRDVAP
jgi:copper(I)-binding protein